MSQDIYSEGEYLEKHPTWHREDSAWKANHISKVLTANSVQVKSLLEIGCGAGKILQELKHALSDSASITGIEISPQAYDMAIRDNPGSIEFIHGSFESLNPNSPFDVVMMIDVFEHVEDYYGFLKEAKKFGKKFVFHIPLDLSVQTVLRTAPLGRKRKNLGHIHYFNKITAIQTLEHSGYKVIDHFYTSSYTDLTQKSFGSKVMKYPRKFLFSLMPEFTVRILGGYALMVLAEKFESSNDF